MVSSPITYYSILVVLHSYSHTNKYLAAYLYLCIFTFPQSIFNGKTFLSNSIQPS